MIKVLALMKYGDLAASTRQRLLQYRPYLSRFDIQVEYVPLLNNDYVQGLASGKKIDPIRIAISYAKRAWILCSRRDFDVVWLNYEVFPYLPGFVDLIAKIPGKPVICDFDDAVFHQYDSHSNRLIRIVLGGKLKPLLTAATACICGNAYLKEYTERFCENSIIVPTVLDVQTYKAAMSDIDSSLCLSIGWIGSSSTWSFVEPYVPLLRAFASQHSARIRVVGAGSQATACPEIQFIDWSEDTEVSEIQAMDIGIMPLPDEPWARGKCGYKLIQYMACGLPVIASPVGVNRHIVVHGETGFLASTEAEWLDALTKLAVDPALRRRMGLAGRARVEAEFSLQVQAPRLAELIRAVVA